MNGAVEEIQFVTEAMAQGVMLGFAGLFAFVGLVWVASPPAVRRIDQRLHSNGAVRVVSLAAMLAGAAFVYRGELTAIPALTRALGAVFFIVGGIAFLLPQVAIVAGEWVLDRSDARLRLFSLVFFILAALFYFAAHSAAPPIV